MLKIIDNTFVNAINNVVAKIFINLNDSDLKYVQTMVQHLLDYMCMKFGFDLSNVNEFYILMTQNNNQHILSSVKLLFPYIDDTNEFVLFAEIYDLKDITIKKKPQEDLDSDPTKNPYLINTFQYSRSYLKECSAKRDALNSSGISNSKDYPTFKEYEYSKDDIQMVYLFLLETIELSRSKLYINWLDILPISRKSYKDSKLYKKSFSLVNGKLMIDDELIGNMELSNTLQVNDVLNLAPSLYYRGISIHDMFNAFNIFLYNDIVGSGTKWLLYEQQIEQHEQPITYLELLHNIVDINNLELSFDDLGNKSVDIISKWKQIENSTIEMDQRFIRCLMLKFDNSYCDKDIAEQYDYDYNSFYGDFTDEYLEDEDIFLSLDEKNMDSMEYIAKKKDFFDKIPLFIIYEFVYEQIEKFKKTWYGKQMIVDDEKNPLRLKIQTLVSSTFDIGDTEVKTRENTYFVTYKNIYNYAKSIIIATVRSDQDESNKTWKPCVISSRNISDTMWTTFFDILNDEHVDQHGDTIKWFTIKNVVNKTYGRTTNSDIDKFQKRIDINIRKNLKDIIFLVLINAGLLSELKPNPQLTDDGLLGLTDDERKANIKKHIRRLYVDTPLGEEMLDTEYYLTRRKYKNLELYKNKQRITWFEHLATGQPWYRFFAMSIISQLEFNLHFLNNRVMMVTGSTGQGKSTVVVMLLYYASIALSMNLRSKVLSTQALISATTKNSKFISSMLGVPIEENGNETFNEYVQYSTQKDKHAVINSSTYIKEVTDRTLLEQLKANPLLKIPLGKKKLNSDENLYDVIIVDEAHMHNTSMDMILTIIKNSILINNQVKLIITSATMEADEYIYRRYYRFIDDNFMYPMIPRQYKNKLLINGYGHEEYDEDETDSNAYVYDRNFIDRRFHISPPGQTSRYIVDDIYLANDTKTYEEAEAKGISTVKQIIDSSSGDFLFFTTTTANVIKITRELNKHTPDHVIALPLYSDMRESVGTINWFSVVESISDTLKTISYDKKDIVDVIIDGEDAYTKIFPGKYTQAILVATNVVEASVTIDTLRYVIDTGYSLQVNFDSLLNKNIVATNMISDASRMQRRGRIGRVASGKAYYMYAKDARAHIKPGYELVTKDITFDVFNIMAENANTLLYDLAKHPQAYKDSKSQQITYKELCSTEQNKEVRKIYEKQYSCSVENVYGTYPFGDTFTRVQPDDLAAFFPVLYESGFGYTNLVDKNAIFYIVHPGEQYIDREIMSGTVLNDNTSCPTKFSQSFFGKTISIMNTLVMIKYIYYDKTTYEQYHSSKEKLINYDYDKHVFKYKYVVIINKLILENSDLFSNFGKTVGPEVIVKFIKTISVSNMLGCQENVMKILALLYSIGKYKVFIRSDEKNPKIKKFDEFTKKWKNNGSELKSYLAIMNYFDSFNKDSEKIVSNIESDAIINQRKIFDDLVTKHGYKLFVDESIINKSKLSTKELKLFTESRNQRLSVKKITEKFKETAKEHLIENSNVDEKCKTAYITTKCILDALSLYNKIVIMMAKPEVLQFLSEFKDIYLINYTTDDCITMSFLENYVEHIHKYDTTQKKFRSIFNGRHISQPRILLTNLYDSKYFYCHRDDRELFGITPVTNSMIRNIISALPDENHLIDPMTLTNKSNVTNISNSKNDMNVSIGAELRNYTKKK